MARRSPQNPSSNRKHRPAAPAKSRPPAGGRGGPKPATDDTTSHRSRKPRPSGDPGQETKSRRSGESDRGRDSRQVGSRFDRDRGPRRSEGFDRSPGSRRSAGRNDGPKTEQRSRSHGAPRGQPGERSDRRAGPKREFTGPRGSKPRLDDQPHRAPKPNHSGSGFRRDDRSGSRPRRGDANPRPSSGPRREEHRDAKPLPGSELRRGRRDTQTHRGEHTSPHGPGADAEGERLQKVLSRAGLASRREAEDWIRAGRITINGQPAVLGARVSSTDQVRLDGRLIRQRDARSAVTAFICHRSPGESLTQLDRKSVV